MDIISLCHDRRPEWGVQGCYWSKMLGVLHAVIPPSSVWDFLLIVQRGCKDCSHHDCIPTSRKNAEKSSFLLSKKLKRFYWPETFPFTFHGPVHHHMAVHSHRSPERSIVSSGDEWLFRDPLTWEFLSPSHLSASLSVSDGTFSLQTDFLQGATWGEPGAATQDLNSLTAPLSLSLSGLLIKFQGRTE